jgi:hypothetical protein
MWRARILGVGRDRRHAGAAREVLRRARGGEPYLAAELAFHGDLEGGATHAARLEPGSQGALHHRAVSLAAAGRWEEAIGAQRELLSRGDYGNVCIHVESPYLIGETLLAAGRPSEALEALRSLEGAATSASPADAAANGPRGRLVRVRALEALARRDDAVRELDELLDQWANAERDLPLLALARAVRSRLLQAGGTSSPMSTRDVIPRPP